MAEHQNTEKSFNLRATLNEVYDWAESLILALAVVVVVLTFTVRISRVDGSSMLPTLVDNEYMLISSLFYTPDYGDIVVLHAKNLYDENGEAKPIVKRIIGLPGDVIEIDFDEGVVYRNSEALSLQEIDGVLYEDGYTIKDYTHYQNQMDGPVTVPEGCVFVLGDNRNNSRDSRDRAIGNVDMHYIMGKVILRILPFDKLGSVS